MQVVMGNKEAGLMYAMGKKIIAVANPFNLTPVILC